jgi:hypothetical protein
MNTNESQTSTNSGDVVVTVPLPSFTTVGRYRLKKKKDPSTTPGGYHSFAHGKVIYATTMADDDTNAGAGSDDYTAVYVGSHNFSKKAWGLRHGMPGNVEFGIVLLTTSVGVSDEWKARIPYQLPIFGAPNKDADYEPGRSSDVFEYTGIGNDVGGEADTEDEEHR